MHDKRKATIFRKSLFTPMGAKLKRNALLEGKTQNNEVVDLNNIHEPFGHVKKGTTLPHKSKPITYCCVARVDLKLVVQSVDFPQVPLVCTIVFACWECLIMLERKYLHMKNTQMCRKPGNNNKSPTATLSKYMHC